jgi:hypothetical protein
MRGQRNQANVRNLAFCETEHESGSGKTPEVVRHAHECWRRPDQKSEAKGFPHDLLIMIDQEIMIKVIHLTGEYS